MKRNHILNFYDLLKVEVPSSVYPQLYSHFEVNDNSDEKCPWKLSFEEVEEIDKRSLTMVSNYMAYSNEKEIIYILDKNGRYCRSIFGMLDKNSVKIIYEKGFSRDFAINFIIKPLLRSVLLKNGLAFIHASSFCRKGKAVLMAAWAHTGKTSTLLSNVMNGAEYLGDDLSVIDKDGYVRPFPVPINLFYYNFKQIPAIKNQLTLSFKLKFVITNSIASFFSLLNHLAWSSKMKYLYYAGKTFFDAASHVPFQVKRKPNTRIQEVKYAANKTVLLERTSSTEPNSEIITYDLSNDLFSSRMQHCINYEFQRFNELSISALWIPFYQGNDLPRDLEKEIYLSFVKNSKLKGVRIPQKMNFLNFQFQQVVN